MCAKEVRNKGSDKQLTRIIILNDSRVMKYRNMVLFLQIKAVVHE